jgi:hypothetical protein
MSDRNPVAERLHIFRRKERKLDVALFIVAGALAVFVLGAIGYGLLNVSQTNTAVPSPVMTHQAIKAATPPPPKAAITPTNGKP